MRQLTNSISADGQVRRETKNGVDYLVFPSVIAKEGVMSYPEFGRDEYLPAESLEQTVDRWADMPITVNHPPDRGEGRTAKTPESYTSEVIGRTFNPELVGGDRVTVENWVDIQRARSFGDPYDRMVDLLESDDTEQIGVSAGYGTIGDEPEQGTFKGNSYSLRQGAPDPNHVALVTPNNVPRMGPEDGVGAPRLNHVDMSASPDDSTETAEPQNPPLIERARAFGAAFRESFGFTPDGSEVTTNAESPEIRTNVQVGDAVRWESSSGGEREPDDVRYGVVVDGLQDGPDDSVLVAVYQADSDYDGWENRNEQQSMQEDTLETVGSDGVESLPAVSQVITTNTIEDPDEDEDVGSDSDDAEEAEADDSDEADAEPTDPDTDDSGDDPDDTENTLLESMSNDTDDFDRDETIESLASDEDVPFDSNVLEEMTDEQILTISPDAADGDEAPDDVDDGRKEDGVDEEDASASAEDADEEDDADEDGEDDGEAETETQTEPESPETPESPGDDTDTMTEEVEMTVNALEERLNTVEEELEATKEENQELREKVDPDVLQAKQARELLCEQADMSEEEIEEVPDQTAISLASTFGDSQQAARANTMPGQQAQQRPNMAGAPGPVSRTNTEAEEYTAGREAYEKRKNGDN